MKYHLTVVTGEDPTVVVEADFTSESSVPVLQAVALFLNHIAQKEEIRESQTRMYSVDPCLERDLNRAQLAQLLTGRRPADGGEPAADGTDRADDARLYHNADTNRAPDDTSGRVADGDEAK